MQRILTGDRPTGALHLGHYFGSLQNRRDLQEKHETFIMIADVQALTDYYDEPERVRASVLEVAKDNMALGLLDATSLFVQSQIPCIAELTVFYGNLVTVNQLHHNPTVKAEIRQKAQKFGKDGAGVTYGFLGYPISQAADITFVRAGLVPVGADQIPVIEQCRHIVDRFHDIYKCTIFPHPEPLLGQGKRIRGIDGEAKMSKSLNNAIFLKDSPEETLAKFKSAKTDLEPILGYDPEKRPAVSNLLDIYCLFHNISPQEALDELGPMRYGAFKIKLAETVNEKLKAFRERRKELDAHPEKVFAKLAQGRERALLEGSKTMERVREAMKISY